MISEYLEIKKNAWTKQTLITVKSVLERYGNSVQRKQSAEALVKLFELNGIKRYTQQTYMMYLRGFWRYMHDEEAPYAEFLKANKQLFKNAYGRKTVNCTFEKAQKTLHDLPPSLEREACLRMLLSAQRASEAGLYRGESNKQENINEDTIVGKGGRVRANLSPIGTDPVSYFRVYTYLREHLGISPHDLRKLALTRAGDNGASAADLCEIAGWTSIETAYYYLQPKDKERLKGMMK